MSCAPTPALGTVLPIPLAREALAPASAAALRGPEGRRWATGETFGFLATDLAPLLHA